MRADLGSEDVGAIAVDRLEASPLIASPLAGEEPTAEHARTTGKVDSAATGYCLWEFDGAAWILKKDRSDRGHVPSPPPSVPGRFRGQLRAVMSVPRSAIVGKQAMVVPDTRR
jgi:hypothetical protein